MTSSDLLISEVGSRDDLHDTVGYANPAQVRRLFRRLRAELGARAGAAHLHNTRGLGLANCLAAYEAPIRMNDGRMSKVPLMPFTLGGERAGVRLQPPLLGEHTQALLQEVGYSDAEIEALEARNAIA